MAPLYDPSRRETAGRHDACIDRFEFPNIPCAYPVVWVRAREAAPLCEAEGKRLCDAHEWEGACAGSLEEPDYRFDLAEGRERGTAVEAMRAAHNRAPGRSKSLELRPSVPGGRLRGVEPEDPGLWRRRVGPLRIEHLPGRLLPRVPEYVRRVRPQRQRRRAHEPPARRRARWRAAAAARWAPRR